MNPKLSKHQQMVVDALSEKEGQEMTVDELHALLREKFPFHYPSRDSLPQIIRWAMAKTCDDEIRVVRVSQLGRGHIGRYAAVKKGEEPRDD